jgi:hypothetical protein
MPMNPVATPASEFDDFLYAPIVEGGNGMVLSVLSALARVNVDPWDEAARLARLPCEAATRTLMQLITALPNGLSEGLDAGAVARELVALLPRQSATRAPTPLPAAVARITIHRGALAICLVLCVVLMVIFLARAMAGGPLQEAGRLGVVASPTASAPASVQTPVGAIDRSRDQDALTRAAARDASVPPHSGH